MNASITEKQNNEHAESQHGSFGKMNRFRAIHSLKHVYLMDQLTKYSRYSDNNGIVCILSVGREEQQLPTSRKKMKLKELRMAATCVN